jgi:predicted nucleic acid-binding Zn ribbon protein
MGAEPLPQQRQPLRLADSLAGLQRLLGTARPDDLGVLEAHWSQVIGTRLAAHCELHSLRHGALVISTSDGGVAEQLRYMERDLRSAANAVLGAEAITSVEVRNPAT